METYNISGFMISGFSYLGCCKVFVGFILASMYLTTIFINLILLWVILQDHQLHLPMYAFLGNLSFLDIAYITVTVPKMLVILFTGDMYITYSGCVSQLFFYVFLEGSEAFLLTTMAYDRYIAICFPLSYNTIMERKFCCLLTAVSWMCGGINASIHTTLIVILPFCKSHDVNQFFCDIPPLLLLSCKVTLINELVLFTVGGIGVGLGPFVLILISYFYIWGAIAKIHSAEGRKKTFATCSAHIIVVSLFFGASLFTYIHPPSRFALEESRVVSVLYSILIPMLNPVIYSLRNDSVKQALQKQMKNIIAAKP